MKNMTNAEIEFFVAHYDTRFSERDNQKKLEGLGLKKSKTTIHNWKLNYILGGELKSKSERILELEEQISVLKSLVEKLKNENKK